MALIPKINLKKTGGLIAGSLAAQVVSNKFLAGTPEKPVNQYIQKGVPLLAGIFLSAQKNQLVAAAGDGMIAAAGANLVAGFLPEETKLNLGIGASEVLLSENVMLSGQYGNDFNSAAQDFAGSPGSTEMGY